MGDAVRVRKTVLLATAALAALAADAMAADLPNKAPVYKAPPPSAYNWIGFYVGGHVGGGLATTEFTNPFGGSIFGDSVRSPGFLGGGQLGYNWQAPGSNWVLGLQGDISALASDGDNTCFASSAHTINSTCRVRPELASTLTGRIGYAFGPSDRTLLYIKGGAAWADSTIDLATNNALAGFAGPPITASNTTASMWGWTVGGGAEYALSPAWSLFLAYDFLDFANASVGTLGSAVVNRAGSITAVVPPGTSSVSENIQEFKLGLNYRWGADPTAGWDVLPVVPTAYPTKAPLAPAWAPGWEIEGGGRYFYSWGLFHKDIGPLQVSSVPGPTSVSRLTYNDMQTNSGEFFARIDSPWNLFVKGFVGGGGTDNGHMNDEDFGILLVHNTVYAPYSNTLANNVTGNITYGVVDVGYDFWRAENYKVGGFVGYAYFKQNMNAFGCTPIANVNCAPSVPTSGNPAITESDTWEGLRLGVAGDVMVTDRVKLSGDVAYLPYLSFSGVDHHFFGNTGLVAEIFPESSNGGQGVQLEAVASYYFTPQFSMGVGGRYWGMWTTNGSLYRSFSSPRLDEISPSPPAIFRGTFEQAGAFVQLAYKFGGP